ncbi:hypothetical protein [Halobacteriovorax sp. JY17]|uniref:hypothetical protein n=1 Tax=Halobacteriovorax sp. JY17 TaxID=2014617 RepID=UPI000C558405|nr:hypothetical protein [Halobacteriovorax sp. JY17]PIK15987.1 MAG: hypothetical protein CES88_04460 [Halobacteriovorax sp. JY17]
MKSLSKLITLHFLFLLTGSVWAGIFPTIDLPFGEKLVSELCFDSGYIREKNFTNQKNIKPILQKTILKFVDGSEYIKNDFLANEYPYYNPRTQRFEKETLGECTEQLVEKGFEVEHITREASIPESIFYGNLKNYGVNDTAMETWKKWGSFNRYIKYAAENDRVKLVPDFSSLSEQSQLNNFIAWRDLSGKVLGGEQSGGGGAGRVRVNMNMTASEVTRINQSPNYLERLFGTTTFFDSVIYDNKKVPRGRIFVTVPKK